MAKARARSARRKPTAVLTMLCVLLAVASSARADVTCTGQVLEHLVYADGTLMMRSQWRNDWTYLCNLQSPWKGVSTESCFTWFGLLTAAKTNAKPVIAYYSGDQACASLPTYANSVAPVYVRMGQ